MASLTPGVLSKLLQNVGNKDVKVTGSEHRSALLQVIEIVPKSTDDDPWQSRGGFFLKLSDSLHSAYVSISDDDADFIFTDKIQLGQFVYVARLHSGSPVPVLRGLKPVPRRPPCPCVGNPTDLVSSDLLPIPANVGFSKSSKGSKANVKKNDDGLRRGTVEDSKAKMANRLVLGGAKSRRNSLGNGKMVEGLELRRLSLDSARRVWDQRPTPKIAAGATTTTTIRPITRPKSKETSTFSDSPSHLSDKKAFPNNDSSLKRPSSSISPLKNKNGTFTPKSTGKPLEKDFNSSSVGTIPSHLVKVPISFKTWSDQRISWDMIPPPIHDLGKEAASHRNVAILAAVHALEEASAAEGVIHCMRTFAELCNSSQKLSAGSLVEQFLTLHQSMQRAERVVNSVLNTGLHEAKSSTCSLQYSMQDVCKIFTNKNAISWVQAAIETDLSKFCLFRKQEKSEISNGNCHYVVLENPPKEMNTENHSPHNKRSRNNREGHLPDSNVKLTPSPSRRQLSAAKKMNNERKDWSKGSGLKEAASLAQKLLMVSREWFLKYLEDSLNMKFGLCKGEGSSEIARLLRQLKRVNEWLDDFVGGGLAVDERIEDLRKKLYEFLLEHVDSAVAASK